jgi:hypothetical protein
MLNRFDSINERRETCVYDVNDLRVPPACRVCKDLFAEDFTDVSADRSVACRSCELVFDCVQAFHRPEEKSQIITRTVARGIGSMAYPVIQDRALMVYPFSVRGESTSKLTPHED